MLLSKSFNIGIKHCVWWGGHWAPEGGCSNTRGFTYVCPVDVWWVLQFYPAYNSWQIMPQISSEK